MSLATWKKKYYPMPARECPAALALQFDRRKWIGLLPQNRKKHGVRLTTDQGVAGLILTDGTHTLAINGSCCASCLAHHFCVDCPLFDCQDDSLWDAFVNRKAVRPMLEHIERAIKKQKEGG